MIFIYIIGGKGVKNIIPIVIEIGNQQTRAGYAGEDFPSIIIDSVNLRKMI